MKEIQATNRAKIFLMYLSKLGLVAVIFEALFFFGLRFFFASENVFYDPEALNLQFDPAQYEKSLEERDPVLGWPSPSSLGDIRRGRPRASTRSSSGTYSSISPTPARPWKRRIGS